MGDFYLYRWECFMYDFLKVMQEPIVLNCNKMLHPGSFPNAMPVQLHGGGNNALSYCLHPSVTMETINWPLLKHTIYRKYQIFHFSLCVWKIHKGKKIRNSPYCMLVKITVHQQQPCLKQSRVKEQLAFDYIFITEIVNLYANVSVVTHWPQ